jgi:hypothetical protein
VLIAGDGVGADQLGDLEAVFELLHASVQVFEGGHVISP